MKRIFRARDFQPDADRDVTEELQAHLELKVEDLMAQGMGEEEAWVEARRAVHGRDSEVSTASGKRGTAELAATSRNWRLARSRSTAHTRTRLRRRSLLDRFDTLGRDVRYALRRMARSPGFTAIAILSLAIGIGANTAAFSAVNAFLIREAPFRAPEQLIRIYTSFPQISPYRSTSYPDFQDMRAMDDLFSDVGAYESSMSVARLGDEPRRVLVEAVSAGLFPMLGVEPVLGRSFLPEEDVTPGEHPVVILNHAFWQEAFGGDLAILGRTLTVGTRPYTVVGVTPEWFKSISFTGLRIDLFVPLMMVTAPAEDPARIYQNRNNSRFNLMARLAPGVTLEEAQSRLDLLAARLKETYPESDQERSFLAMPNREVAISPELDQGLELSAVFLLVVVGLVLLLACTNLASFLLARGVERQKEVAMRLALGASRGRLIRQLLTETLLMALIGGVAGLVVARAILDFVVAYQPPIPVSFSLELGLDRTVFLFTLGISALAGIFFGLAPAIRSTNPDVTPTLKEGGGSGAGRRFNLQTGLVALQMTVSMILLVGGGLFLRSLITAQSIDPGFSTEKAGIAWLDLEWSQIPRDEWNRLRSDLEERLLAQPGVEKVTSAGRLPLSLGSSVQTLRIPGVDPPPGLEGHRIQWTRVSLGYFDAMDIPILAGRAFTPDDRPGSPGVILVSREMARRFWPGEDPLGKEVFRAGSERPLTVVGVVGDVKVSSLGGASMPFVYFPMAQSPPLNLQLLIRGPLPAAELVATLRRVIREAEPSLLVLEVKTMENLLDVRLFGPRAAAFLLGIFGALALLLSSIGLYGVVSFSVSRRVREMGIRMSLGADARQVLRMVVGRALGMVVVGGVVGLAVAFVLARLVRTFLVGIAPGDPLTLIGVPLLLVTVAMVAALIPARRASRVNPVEALRSE